MSELSLLNVIQKMEEKYIIDVENGLIKHKNINFTRKIGCKRPNGYIGFRFNYIDYRVNRIILTKFLGREIKPDYKADHINHNKSDNRISNLRELSNQENTQHQQLSSRNTSGFKGVCWNKDNKKWRAEIRLNNKTLHLGYFDTAELAYEAWKKKAQELNEKGFKYFIP